MASHASIHFTGKGARATVWCGTPNRVTIRQGNTSVTMEPAHVRALAAALDVFEAEQKEGGE